MTTPGTGSRAAGAAVRRHKFPRCDPVRHDLDARRAVEEIGLVLSFSLQRSSRALASMPRQTGQSTKARRGAGTDSHRHALIPYSGVGA